MSYVYFGPQKVNYPYLRTKPWYKIFSLTIVSLQLATVIHNVLNKKKFEKNGAFNWQTFFTVTIVMAVLIQILKFGVTWFVERGKMWAPNDN